MHTDRVTGDRLALEQKTVNEESRLLRVFVCQGSHPFQLWNASPVEEGIILKVKYFFLKSSASVSQREHHENFFTPISGKPLLTVARTNDQSPVYLWQY